MLSPDQQNAFEENGYLVVPDVLTSQELAHIQSEYAQLLEGLYHKWFKDGRVKTAPETLDFWQKLALSYEAGCDWFQPLDISLPGDQIFSRYAHAFWACCLCYDHASTGFKNR